MYEYIADFEKWKKNSTIYQEKLAKVHNFIKICQNKCEDNKINKEECINLCKKPLIDLENFNINIIKRMSVEIYELCNEKIYKTAGKEINNELIRKMKACGDNLYRDNDLIIKKEITERVDNILKFLS
jgi:hypothetical protein